MQIQLSLSLLFLKKCDSHNMENGKAMENFSGKGQNSGITISMNYLHTPSSPLGSDVRMVKFALPKSTTPVPPPARNQIPTPFPLSLLPRSTAPTAPPQPNLCLHTPSYRFLATPPPFRPKPCHLAPWISLPQTRPPSAPNQAATPFSFVDALFSAW